MQVPRLVAVAVLGLFPQQLRQPLHAGNPHDVDVVVTTESLEQREVDLQRDVILIFLIRGEETQNHAVRISAAEPGGEES